MNEQVVWEATNKEMNRNYRGDDSKEGTNES